VSKRLLEDARRVIRINSVTSSGNEELVNLLSGMMQDRGLRTTLQQVTHSLEDVSKRQFNLIGVLGDPLVDRKIRKGLLLNTHLDTVGPGLPENWTETGGDPFSATLRDGRIYGLGSADVKIDFLCKLYAVEKFRERKLKMPIYLVGTCGEELGMFGAKYLIKSGALNPRYVVVGEPSDMKVVYAHKSLNLYRVSIAYHMVSRDARGFNRRIDLHSLGKSAHGSYPHLGTNAILAMTDFLQRAADSGFELRFTQLDGGETVNKVPDRASAQFYLTSHQFEDFKRFFREVVRADAPAAADKGGAAPLTKAFRVELGGIGDAGVRFLPEAIFPCLAEVIAFFRSMAADFEKVRDDSYNPAHSTMNFGKLRQGMSGIDLHFDLRLLPDLMADEIEKHIQKGIDAIAARFPNLNVSAVRERMNPGLGMKREDELVLACAEAMKAAGIEPALDKKATSTEAAQYFQAGYPAVVFGPGKSLGNSHSPNEHNLVDQIEKATLFYERLIERTCT
jgi:acetylornithine deacetylase/succinyl-diaminopimelate desuccinylase-like protein